MGGEAMLQHRDLVRLWSAILGRLEFDVRPHQFRTWLKPTRALGLEGATLLVEAPSSFACDWLTEQLGPAVVDAVAEAAGPVTSVRFVPRRAADVDCPFEGARIAARVTASPGPIGTIAREFTFDRYLVGEGNRVAVSSCHELIESEERSVSPLVIFGSPGMGKTHLLHALAGRAMERGWPLACFRAEEFTNRYMEAVRSSRLPEFQASVRGVRLFVLDDLQYLDGKTGTQNEFVNTIDTLLQQGGMVACGSERPPLDLNFVERLATRLSGGTSIHVRPFCYAERLEFVGRVAAERKCELPAWAAERVANINARSVREVLGAANVAISLARCGELALARLDTELVKLSLELAAPKGVCDQDLIERIAGYFETTFAEIAGRSRKPAVTGARAVAIAALREQGRSNAVIATLLGNRDRTTISQLSGRGREMIEADSGLTRLLA